MKSKVNNFDLVAGVYDTLAKIVFGKRIKEAQCVFLSELGDVKTILIIGGGTGWLLEEVLKVNQKARIWYVEASMKMLAQARERSARFQLSRIRFIHGTEHDLPDQPTFDAVVANFFFDMFMPTSLPVVMNRIKRSMNESGVLIVTDFTQPKKLWHNVLLRTMYAFFRSVSNLEARTLPAWQSMLNDNGFREITFRHFYDGFIEARKYVLK